MTEGEEKRKQKRPGCVKQEGENKRRRIKVAGSTR